MITVCTPLEPRTIAKIADSAMALSTTSLGCDHFLPRHRHRVKKGLHWRFAKAPASLMWPRLIVFRDPGIQVSLQLVDRTVHLFAERDTIEFVEHGLVEAFTDAVGLRALGLGARVIDVLDRKIELVLVPFGIAAILAAAVGQHAQQLNLMAVEEWQDPVVQKIGRRDWRLAIIELGEGHLAVGVDEGLLVDPPHALQIADIERILAAAVARMLALELAVGLLLGLGPFERHDLGLGEHQAFPGALGLQGFEPLLHGLEVVAQPHATYAR